MDMLKKLLHELKDEVKDAEKYYKCSMKYKENYPAWATEYSTLAQQEVSHFEKLKNMAEQYVQKHPELRAIFEFELDWMMEDLAPLKAKLRL